jgi:hypothetical protein
MATMQPLRPPTSSQEEDKQDDKDDEDDASAINWFELQAPLGAASNKGK